MLKGKVHNNCALMFGKLKRKNGNIENKCFECQFNDKRVICIAIMLVVTEQLHLLAGNEHFLATPADP